MDFSLIRHKASVKDYKLHCIAMNILHPHLCVKRMLFFANLSATLFPLRLVCEKDVVLNFPDNARASSII